MIQFIRNTVGGALFIIAHRVVTREYTEEYLDMMERIVRKRRAQRMAQEMFRG